MVSGSFPPRKQTPMRHFSRKGFKFVYSTACRLSALCTPTSVDAHEKIPEAVLLGDTEHLLPEKSVHFHERY